MGVPSFLWSPVTGATVYRLQVDSEIGFYQPIILDITTRNTTFTPWQTGHLVSDGELYWRIRVKEPAPVGEWSPIMRCTKTWATNDNKPNLLAPADGSLLAIFDTPALSWTPVIGAAKYRFQIANTPSGFDSPIYFSATLSKNHQPNNRLANGTYYWRVLPIDTADPIGTPSDVQSSTLAYGTYQINMVPSLIIPIDEPFPTFTPTFHWSGVIGAEHYRLEYTSDKTCDFSRGTSLLTR